MRFVQRLAQGRISDSEPTLYNLVAGALRAVAGGADLLALRTRLFNFGAWRGKEDASLSAPCASLVRIRGYADTCAASDSLARRSTSSGMKSRMCLPSKQR